MILKRFHKKNIFNSVSLILHKRPVSKLRHLDKNIQRNEDKIQVFKT